MTDAGTGRRGASTKELAGLGCVVLCLWLLCALLSYSSTDNTNLNQESANWIGPIGAIISHTMFKYLGRLAAFTLVFMFAFWSMIVFFQPQRERLLHRLLGTSILVAALAVFESMIITSGRIDPHGPGGVLGLGLNELLFQPMGAVGAWLFLIALILMSLALATDRLLMDEWRAFWERRKANRALEQALPSDFTDEDSQKDIDAVIQVVQESSKSKERDKEPVFKIEARPLDEVVKAGVTAPADIAKLEDEEDSDEEYEDEEYDDEYEDEEYEDDDEEYEDEEYEDDEEEYEDGTPADDNPDIEEAGTQKLKTKGGITRRDHSGESEDESVPEVNTVDFVSAAKAHPGRRIPKVHRSPTGKYKLPPLNLVSHAPRAVNQKRDEELIKEKAKVLQKALKDFGLDVQIVEIDHGPVITQYELELAAGIKVNKILSLSDDIAMALKATAVRIVAPIPGKSTVGIEVPKEQRQTVSLRELIEARADAMEKDTLPMYLGRDIMGQVVVADLAKMPHLLMAGATGSGKSVCLNSCICSILMTRSPEEVKFILVDPKQVELSFYKDIPFLSAPVITDMKKVPGVLEWAVKKMEERYDILSRVGVRDIKSFNKLGEKEVLKRLKIEGEEVEVDTFMPYFVIVIDELADLMMTQGAKEVEASIQRLAQKSRAVGIHVILATQRPSVDVITGLIKSNMPSRISFRVSSKVDSRCILDQNGADKLLGMGDMLFLPPASSDLMRVQGAYLPDDENRDIVEYWKKQGSPSYNDELVNWHKVKEEVAQQDELFHEAVEVVLRERRGSVSLVQRALGVGYTRAARLVEMMAKAGLVGEYKGSVAREVLVSLEEWEEAQQGNAKK